LYGPIPSRRLGQSLGVDPVPLKTCNWNCVYCQLGRTTPLIHERRVYVPTGALLDELTDFFARASPPHVDWVSFVGSGEPTLHSELGVMIRGAKAIAPAPVAVITNGTLLYDPLVRADLAAADLVMPTFSAGSEATYRKLHRPHPQATFALQVDGLRALRQEYQGRLWVEVMLVHGVNDAEEELEKLARLIREIGPDEVQVTLPTRPPAEAWVKPPDADGLMRAIAILGQDLVVGHPNLPGLALDASGVEGMVEELWAILVRHPMSERQIGEAVAGRDPALVAQVMSRLEGDDRIHRLYRMGTPFWVGASARYVGNPGTTASELPTPTLGRAGV
jgi:wyosine [tRNA(Phe)-imidazoG37] synthetase (radical SAM superfamily)